MKAGAWTYDINNQDRQYQASQKAYLSANALLGKYAIRAPKDGRVLAISPTVGSYVSAQGAYDSYTQSNVPVVVVGSSEAELNVRCYVDEIPGAPPAGAFEDQGADVSTRIERQVRVGVRPNPADRVSQDRTVESAPGARRCPGAPCHLQTSSRASVSSGRPVMRCLSVWPSRNSMAIELLPVDLIRSRRWCRCPGD